MDNKVSVIACDPDWLVDSIVNKLLASPLLLQILTPAKDDDLDRYLTRAEVAQKCHITLQTVNQWTKSGRLRGYRIGRRVLFKAQEIDLAIKKINIGRQ